MANSESQSTTGCLYIVATPIGNLADLTFRAVTTLRTVALIVCEDTRLSRRLLDHYDIKTPTAAYHQHSRRGDYQRVIDYLYQGQDVAVITDAGTPGIADPGNLLVATVVAELGLAVKISPVPGSSALTAALSVAGISTDRFMFWGFIPHKKGRQTMLAQIVASDVTAVFYESPHRIVKTLTVLDVSLPATRMVIVCRELTKKFETVYRGNIAAVTAAVTADPLKGEYIVIISK